MPDRNLPLKLFGAIVANANTGSQKSIHTSIDTYLDHMLAEPNRMIRNLQNFELFEKKKYRVFFKPFFDKALTPFCKSDSEKILLNGKLLIFRLLSFSVPKV